MESDEEQYWVSRKVISTNIELYSKGFNNLNAAWDFFDEETENVPADEIVSLLRVLSGSFAKTVAIKRGK